MAGFTERKANPTPISTNYWPHRPISRISVTHAIQNLAIVIEVIDAGHANAALAGS